MITDEIVEKAAMASYCREGLSWESCDDKQYWLVDARAALESALPDLLSAARAEVMEEAIAAVDRWVLYIDDVSYRVVMNALQAARISSLKPKTTDETKP